MLRDKVVLVDINDNAIGTMDKLEAHQKGKLHRAFSVFLFNSKGEMLLQQRASDKYHGGGLWTNACCSHPQLGEDIQSSALERLNYEMGLSCPIKEVFSFIYHAPVENGLIEHEYDHVYIGFTDAQPTPHPYEVQDYRWVAPDNLEKEMQEHPEIFTYWFKKAFRDVMAEMAVYL